MVTITDATEKDMRRLYLRGVSKGAENANPLVRSLVRLDAYITVTGHPFSGPRGFVGYLQTIHRSFGEDGVEQASALISRFSKRWPATRSVQVAADLAEVAKFMPEQFHDSIKAISAAFNEVSPRQAAVVAGEIGLWAHQFDPSIL